MAKTLSDKRAGFFAYLPQSTIKTIRDRSRQSGLPQWEIVSKAIGSPVNKAVKK
jgi:hypothetical protein